MWPSAGLVLPVMRSPYVFSIAPWPRPSTTRIHDLAEAANSVSARPRRSRRPAWPQSALRLTMRSGAKKKIGLAPGSFETFGLSRCPWAACRQILPMRRADDAAVFQLIGEMRVNRGDAICGCRRNRRGASARCACRACRRRHREDAVVVAGALDERFVRRPRSRRWL